ncbi:hypothetical protein N9I30_00430 [Flavobacteriales bacterium]|nr:hypothetical protein [Flavobacteriales bacterium]
MKDQVILKVATISPYSSVAVVVTVMLCPSFALILLFMQSCISLHCLQLNSISPTAF